MTSSRVARLLSHAQNLMPTPREWTQGTAARNWAGEEVDHIDPGAVCFCISGALARACWETHETDDVFGQAHALLPRARDYTGLGTVPAWNDNPERTHAQVMAALSDIILKAA